MAAPSGISWGSIAGGYGRIGIYSKVSTSGTTATVNVQVWFWSKYSVTDNNNSVWFNVGTNITEATTRVDSGSGVDIKHTVASGDGWSTSNQTKIYSWSKSYTMGKSAVEYKVYAEFRSIDKVGSRMLANTTFTVPAKPSYAVKYSANGGSGAPSAQTKWYGETLTLSSTKPTRTGYTFQGWGTTSTDTSANYAAGASYTANAAITLYAIWKINTYAVKYNANGGSGAPSSQTKTYGTTLKLSTTVPTRTGYTFQGWGTSASDTTVDYAKGANYTANAAITLYAIWKINTYEVKYNANGGSGAPSAQAKTYGTTLKLNTTIPKRDGYSFVKWNTNSAGTGTSYAAGANYTANAAVTLYAIWSLDYVKPLISGFSVNRCDANGNSSSSGTKYKLKFIWTTTYANPKLTIDLKTTGSSTWTTVQETLTGTSGTYETVKPTSGVIDLNYSYDIRVTIDDGGVEPTSKTSYINSSIFAIDFLEKNKGVSFGKVAEIENVVESAWDIRSKKNIMTGNKTGWLDGKTGAYLNEDGVIHLQRSTANGYKPYLGFLLDDSTELGAYVRLNGDTNQLELSANGNGCLASDGLYTNKVVLENEGSSSVIYAKDSTGTNRSVIGNTSSDNTVVGYGNYLAGSGNVALYGTQHIMYVVTGPNTATGLVPYINAASSDIGVEIRTAGFITGSSKYLYFQVPLTRPILAGTVVTARSNNGLILRQNNAYTHGSSSSVYVHATYTTIVSTNTAVTIQAVLASDTNAINNAPIGVHWSGYLSFE